MEGLLSNHSTPISISRSVIIFFLCSIAIHVGSIALVYLTGAFSSDDIDSIPAHTISVRIVVPKPVIAPPIVPTKQPLPKKKVKKKMVTKAPAKRTVVQKPKKIVSKAAPKQAIPQKQTIAASPIPSPVAKPAIFSVPQPSYQPKPRYPTIARRRGTEGIVILDIHLTNDGHVSRAIIIQSSGSSALDKSALKTIKTWRFPAGKFNSLSSFKQKIEFRLNRY
ncbi:MAG: energy transducer TonB [Piscirickettsiaceae bacterium]|nr:MAG: energy transducer TonB [Piscirickettsiaceae bacterium]